MPRRTLAARGRPTGPDLSPGAVARFRATVRRRYRDCCRDLPWRRDADPYHIYVSEVMLQQTQVPRVAEKYPVFIARFPAWPALAAASLAEVLFAWQGLGYNRRAKYLRDAAAIVCQRHAGVLPADPQLLRRLPGIGETTACSIAAFAFDVPAVFIETNIRSVFIHHFFEGRSQVEDGELLPLVARTLDRRNPSQWYSALMDYGTVLKKQIANPSRRSRHHVRQSRFEGSTRQLRGALLRAVLGAGGLTLAGLHARVGGARDGVAAVAGVLVREGLLTARRGRFYAPR